MPPGHEILGPPGGQTECQWTVWIIGLVRPIVQVIVFVPINILPCAFYVSCGTPSKLPPSRSATKITATPLQVAEKKCQRFLTWCCFFSFLLRGRKGHARFGATLFLISPGLHSTGRPSLILCAHRHRPTLGVSQAATAG